MTWNNDELATDALPVLGFEHYKAKDYSLAHVPFTGTCSFLLIFYIYHKIFINLDVGSSYAGGQWAAGDEPLYYVVSPKDVVIAKPRYLQHFFNFVETN